MSKRLLIDASHQEQVRVVVLENGKVVEYDSATAHKQQLRGNIYLAKVTRIEPSLQAAFVEYGGRKHGFLPFSEIHPDYYNIPVADKQKLLESVRPEREQEARARDAAAAASVSETCLSVPEAPEGVVCEGTEGEESAEEEHTDGGEAFVPGGEEEDASLSDLRDDADDKDGDDDEDDSKRMQFYKRYKIQDVIRRSQIFLVQVEKEERGNKGASLTTFISLAGKYCVLMPNSLKKGGVSRKIASQEHRRKLRDIISSLEISGDAGIIVRTAGAGKDRAQILADYDYLAGLWNTIRKATLSSDAPAFIHAEEDVVRRSIRDLYDDSFDEALIEGRTAYESARQFITTIMPEHKDKVRFYENKTPLFNRFRAEEQINALFDQSAPLDAGGSIVITPTEAMISVDVNSGKATSQRDVEETALATNLEAAREIARQMRLRDLSGLIVIDFIDMLEYKNRKTVERALKDAFSDDRARVQLGRISNFGLLEMSRQRLRPSLWEMNANICPLCKGTGAVKSSGAIAVQILRAIDHECVRSRPKALKITLHPDVAVYIFNHKRDRIARIETDYETKLLIAPVMGEQFAKNQFSIQRVRYSEEEERILPATERLEAEQAGEQSEETGEAAEQPVRPVRQERERERERGDGAASEGRESSRRRRVRGGQGGQGQGQGGGKGVRQTPEPATAGASGGRRQNAPAQSGGRRPVGFVSVLEGLWRRIVD
jgi:ribonuclease E